MPPLGSEMGDTSALRTPGGMQSYVYYLLSLLGATPAAIWGLLMAAYVLAGVVWLGRNSRGLATVVCVAMLPWLIDFDQDFALFAANAIKFFLAMLPLIFLATRGRSAYG